MPGFSPHERAQVVVFTRIILVGQVVPLMIGNFVTGMLQSMQRFLLPALAPVVYNLAIIGGIVFFSQSHGLYGAVYGVVVGALLYLFIQIPLLVKLGYTHTLRVKMSHTGVRAELKLMLLRTFGLAVAQIDTTVDLILASYLGARAVTIFTYAQHLQQLPIGLFGSAIAQAALPTLSTEAIKTDLATFKKLILVSMHQILFFVLPASAMLIALHTPLVRLMLGGT